MTDVKRDTGLKAMNQDDVNEYMDQLLRGKIDVKGLELSTLGMFRKANARLNNTESEINRVSKRLEELRALASQLRGEASGYASLLSLAEDERRSQPPASTPKRQSGRKQKSARAQVPGRSE